MEVVDDDDDNNKNNNNSHKMMIGLSSKNKKKALLDDESNSIDPPGNEYKNDIISSNNTMSMGMEVDEGMNNNNNNNNMSRWSPSGNWWKDFFFFAGPGWFVSIAYVDPGNYQADIQAGATTRYYLLFAVFWTSVLSIYVQILCVRLAYYGQATLAEAQAANSPGILRYINWFIAEISTVLTDLPEVIGIGIAFQVFFGWPYYVGVFLSLLTTMLFLATMHYGMRPLEFIVFLFVAIMSIALFIEMAFVGVHTNELFSGWAYGFVDVKSTDIFSITGILGSVVMPHNLYLHSAACMSRPVQRTDSIVRKAVQWSSIEPILPIFISFLVNLAVVAIASESVYENIPGGASSTVGLTNFCQYFQKIRGGCILWGIALLSAGQSSAITTTYTGQYVMDGYLNIRLPTSTRAILTRLVAIAPCILFSIAFPNKLNGMVNFVNSSLAFLLPFAFTPLVKYNCSYDYMGIYAAKGYEKWILYIFAILVWAINAIAFSSKGGGFFGDYRPKGLFWILIEIMIQGLYAGWNFHCLLSPIQSPMIPLEQERETMMMEHNNNDNDENEDEKNEENDDHEFVVHESGFT